MNRTQIREIFLRNGFSIKPGCDDLKSYVYVAAEELLNLAEVERLSAAQAEQYPPCDFCGVIPDHHPWHGSGMFKGVDSPHIHACNGCRHLLPSRTAQDVALETHRNGCPLMLHPAQVALTATKQEGTRMMNDLTLELMTCVITSFDGRSNSVYPILAYKQDRSIVIAKMQDLCREVYAEEYAEVEHSGKLNIYAAPFIAVHPTLLEELCAGKSLEESITVLPHSAKLGELATEEKLWEMLTADDVEQRNFAAPNHNLFVTNSYKLLGSLKDVSDLVRTSEFKKVAVK